jgi:hypothetical protein
MIAKIVHFNTANGAAGAEKASANGESGFRRSRAQRRQPESFESTMIK